VGSDGQTTSHFNRPDRIAARARARRAGNAAGGDRQQGSWSWVRLHTKGGKRHEVPFHHSLDQYLDAWIAAAGIGDDKKGPLFRSSIKGNKITGNPMIRSDVLYMIKRRVKGARLPNRPVAIHSERPGLPLICKTVATDTSLSLVYLQGVTPRGAQGS
jgi:hypothetical protein